MARTLTFVEALLVEQGRTISAVKSVAARLGIENRAALDLVREDPAYSSVTAKEARARAMRNLYEFVYGLDGEEE